MIKSIAIFLIQVLIKVARINGKLYWLMINLLLPITRYIELKWIYNNFKDLNVLILTHNHSLEEGLYKTGFKDKELLAIVAYQFARKRIQN